MKDIVSYINEAANKELKKILDCKPKTLEGLQTKMLKYFKSCAGNGLRKIIGSKEAYLNPEDRKKLENKYNIDLGYIKKVSIWFNVGRVAQAQLYIIELYNDGVVLGLRENSHIYNASSTWCIIGSNNPYKYGTNFLTTNKSKGPYAKKVSIEQIKIGDVIQLSFDGISFAHSLIVVQTGLNPSIDNILIASHTIDRDYFYLKDFKFKNLRCLNIQGVLI